MLLGSIRGKLLALVLAVVVPLLALIVAGFWSQWQNTQAAARQRALNDARMLAAQLDDHVGNLEHLLGGLSRAVSINPADTSANDTLLRQAKAELPGFISGIALFTLSGDNIGTSSETSRRTNISDRAYFGRVLAGQRLAISDVHIGRTTRQWVTNIARRVEDRTGELRAVLVVGTLLERFHEFLRLDALPAGSAVKIVNEQGVVLGGSANSPNWIGRDLSDSGQIARLIAAKETSEDARWSDGITRLTGSSTAYRVPWLVSVGVPKDVVFATVAPHLRWSAFFSAIAVISALIIAWMLSGRIVRPLQQLEKDASVLAAGELAHRTAVSTGDEVGKLADAFNRMAIALERRQDEVQQASDTLSAVIDASPVAISCSDLDRRIILWNRSAEQVYGYKAEEVIGQPVKVVPRDGAAESLILYRRAAAGETIRDVQVKRIRKDGTAVHVEARRRSDAQSRRLGPRRCLGGGSTSPAGAALRSS